MPQRWIDFTRSDIGMGKTPIMGYLYSRLSLRRRAPLIPNDLSEIYGRSWGNRDQSSANPGGPLAGPISAYKDASFLERFESVRYLGEKDSDNAISLIAFRDQEEGPVNPQWSVRDLRPTMGKSRPTRHRPGRPSLRTLSASKDSPFPDRF